MADNPAIIELKKDRANLADQLSTLEGGQLQAGMPDAHEARLWWLRGQIVALSVAITKLGGDDDA